uniref:DUF5615 domain-containing protein n=1 Tax=Candidatus Kentrum sp. TUN TaxID=2126343 RepID=A0A450ZY61_9GAMM|nr:MAG: hypothetical protein BECKTUN1418F_GA0071002_108611 [Candidatus Kentron sp. TUN]VFK58739.1 MAG: hypothetical protein BECKTUN1418D_GA0071000_108810 [Candidatus Kentron sp. TUN]VFK62658.1 MAG: hypothetical protein BECKTUN1418E_GA0071001_108411 [Candidatus Kentron sp. TUN]
MPPRNILLDECVDRKIAREITGHIVTTVQKAGWAGFKNGHLLQVAEIDFDILITTDRKLSFQQSLPDFDIAVIVLSSKTNHLPDLLPLVPELLATIHTAKPGTAIVLKTP